MKRRFGICRVTDGVYLVFFRIVFVLFGMASFVSFASFASYAGEDKEQVVKVGCFPYEDQLKRDANGNYSGYGYDYLQELAVYTDWQYEFVDASWSECLSMLERGEIDLLGAVMRSPEREAVFDFSDEPMISGYGVLATPVDNHVLPYEDFKAFDGIDVGILKGNSQLIKFLDYSREHSFRTVIHEFDTQKEMDQALDSGDIDAVIMTNLLHSATLRVVAAFGENDSYFAAAKGDKEFLEELNEAMRMIRMRDPYFNNKLDQKYYDLQASTAISFTREELDFIEKTPPIPCVYIPDALPISYLNKDTGEVQGIAVDMCHILEEKTGLKFYWLKPKSASEAVGMLSSGEALLMPAKYYDDSWAEQNNTVLTSPYLQGQMVMVTNGRTEQPTVVALYDQGSQSRLVEEIVSGEAQLKQYDTVIDCMDAVLKEEADTAFINSTIASYLVNNPKYAQLHTTPLYGYSADAAMAVSGYADPLLVSVLNKGLGNTSATEINQIVLSQMKMEQRDALATYLYLHPAEAVFAVCVLFVILILVLLALFSGRLRSAKEMKKTLYTDGLTGYPNYRALCQEAPLLIEKNSENYALVYLDIHQFKVINDTFGYEVGDQVLIAVSHALYNFVGGDERFARVYADTFVLLINYSTQKKLLKRLDRLAELLYKLSFEHADDMNPLFCGGVYLLPKGKTDLDKACDRANYAKDSIAHHFSNTFVFYDDVMRRRVLEEKELENSMITALEEEQFIPYYQPKVNTITGKVMGAEALVRWNHPEKGCISPAEFLPFYEKNGFIVKIDLSIFEQVCRDIRKGLEKGCQVVPISVNFSRRHMRDSDLPNKLKNIVERYEIPADLLEVEITETEELENVDMAVNFVDALKSFGFGISIDDYGTGYSSISFLQQLPLDALKLDRKFILNAMKSNKAKDIMRYLVVAMQRNEIRVVCEGVETTEQRDFIVSLNCRFIQGFLYSVPLPYEAFEAYLQQHGVDSADRLDFVNITSLEKKRWNDAEDFLIKAAPSWVVSCYTEPDYPVHYISPSFLAVMGYSELEFKEATKGLYVNWIHQEDCKQTLEQLEACRDSVQVLSNQYRVRKKDGSYLYIRGIYRRIVAEDGQEVLLGVCSDVTDMVALQMERSHLIDALPGGAGRILLTGNEPVIQEANERFYDIIGYSREEMEERNNSLYHIFYEKDLPSAEDMLRKLMREDVTSCECCLRVVEKDGGLRWLSFLGNVTQSSPDLMITLVVYNCDDEMNAKQLADISRAKLELALTLTKHAVFEYDILSQTVYSHSGFSDYEILDGTVIHVPREFIGNALVYPEDAQKVLEGHKKLADGEAHISFELRVRARKDLEDAPYIWLRVTLSTIFDEDGRPVKAVGVAENINQQKRFEYAFLQEAQYRRAFTESSLMAYEINLSRDTIGRITGSRGFRLEDICSRTKPPMRYSESLPAAAEALVAQDDRERFMREMSIESLEALYRKGIFESELEYRRLMMDGRELWNSVLVQLLLDQLSGDVMGYVYHRDIHERKENERGLAYQAARDPLTGVYNRTTAEKLIQSFLLTQAASERVQAFLMLDLDRFKQVNDSYGHQTGDKYLIRLTQIMENHLREDDIIARIGGDEFTILLKDLEDENQALFIAEKIAQAVNGVGVELGIESGTSVSIGMAFSPGDGTGFVDLYRYADEAMYRAKKEPYTSVIVYDKSVFR